jgi:hypothetical protein
MFPCLIKYSGVHKGRGDPKTYGILKFILNSFGLDSVILTAVSILREVPTGYVSTTLLTQTVV